MSFKRDGDDVSLLSKLRKRRVTELLGESIPEDEAKLLSNGRFTCSVCNNIPIFDTVDMLMVHRSGKKHLAKLKIFEAKKQELRDLKLIRKHEQLLKNGAIDDPIRASQSRGILHSAPYNPCAKNKKRRPTDRKTCLSLEDIPQAEAVNPIRGWIASSSRQSVHAPALSKLPSHQPQASPTECMATPCNDLPGSTATSSWMDIAAQQLAGPVIHDRQLKKVFEQPSQQGPVRSEPYQSKRLLKKLSYTKYGTAVPLSKINISSCKHSVSARQSEDHTEHQQPSNDQFTPVCDVSKQQAYTNCTATSFSQLQLPPSSPHKQQKDIKEDTTQTSKEQLLQLKNNRRVTSLDDNTKAKLIQLQGSGWKRDWDGKWIRDEDAEFDSDEEPPDIP